MKLKCRLLNVIMDNVINGSMWSNWYWLIFFIPNLWTYSNSLTFYNFLVNVISFFLAQKALIKWHFSLIFIIMFRSIILFICCFHVSFQIFLIKSIRNYSFYKEHNFEETLKVYLTLQRSKGIHYRLKRHQKKFFFCRSRNERESEC